MNEKIPKYLTWTRSDYMKLSWAVRKFNKTVNELRSLDQNVLPPEFDYTTVRDSIYSEMELNRVLKSLKRFEKKSQQKVVLTDTGEMITQWELSELKKSQKRAINRLTSKARGIIESDVNVMGDKEFKKLVRTKESIEDLFNRKGYEFRRTSKRTSYWGTYDFEYIQAEIFRENFMNALDEMKTYKNYRLLKRKLKTISNPIQFYKYVSQSETLKDLFLYYKDKATAQTYGGFVDNQEAFNKALFDDLKLPRPENA